MDIRYNASLRISEIKKAIQNMSDLVECATCCGYPLEKRGIVENK